MAVADLWRMVLTQMAIVAPLALAWWLLGRGDRHLGHNRRWP
jgi:hypothetical protein